MFCALDLFVFFVMFEIVLVPMYFLIGGWGYGERVYAALKFFIFTMLGSALMLVGIVSLAFLHRDGVAEDNEAEAAAIEQCRREAQQDGPATAGARSSRAARTRPIGAAPTSSANPPLDFDLVEIAESQHLTDDSTSGNPFDWSAVRWIFLAFAVAFAVKVPLFPLHTWLPDAHTQAPTAGSVILAGVMLKLGTYGFVRFGLYLFPEASVWFAPALVTLGVIGIIYGAIVATMQRDLKRLVAYSSVAHLGFIILGTFALTTQGIQGGVMQMVNHGLSTGALFLLVGMIYERRHTREISALKGLQKSAPILAGVFTLVMLSSIGLPGPQRLRRRVPHPRRLVPHPAVVHRRRRGRRDPRRALPPVGLPARVPRRARRGQRRHARPHLARGPRDGAAGRADRVPRRVPAADARPHPAVGRPPRHPHRGPLRLRAARGRVTGAGEAAEDARRRHRGGGGPVTPLLAVLTQPIDQDPVPVGGVDVAWSAVGARCSP